VASTMAANTITTSNSSSVKPLRERIRFHFPVQRAHLRG
jgi:hypothetical protein